MVSSNLPINSKLPITGYRRGLLEETSGYDGVIKFDLLLCQKGIGNERQRSAEAEYLKFEYC